MARHDSTAGGIGCLAVVFLGFVAVCSGGGSGGSPSRSTDYSYPTPASTPAPPPDYASREWFHIHGTMNVRTEPDPDARVVRTLSRGDHVQLGPRNANGWARLYGGGTTEEYVYRASDLVRAQAPATPQPLVSSGSRSGSSGRARRSGGGRELHVGPRGGCYYINSNGNKTYVDRSECH